MRVTIELSAMFSSKKRQKFLDRLEKYQNKNNVDGSALPSFSGLLRKIYMKSHPDLLKASHPEYASVNDDSIQVLNGIISTIKEANQYPPQIVKTIPFHVKNGNDVRCISLDIKTAGGDCRNQLKNAFQRFFAEAGVLEHGSFRWDKEYFPTEK